MTSSIWFEDVNSLLVVSGQTMKSSNQIRLSKALELLTRLVASG
jgi:hypothetical protein